jgi:hypothetical protein
LFWGKWTFSTATDDVDVSFLGPSHSGETNPALCESSFEHVFALELASLGASRARLQIEGMAFHFPDDVFSLNLALEVTEGVVY